MKEIVNVLGSSSSKGDTIGGIALYRVWFDRKD